jgi:HAD superfamily hydrolase (TIGR01458 family)
MEADSVSRQRELPPPGPSANPPNIAGVLLDLDGVLYVGNQVIEGAVQAIETLRSAAIPIRFITNTSTQARSSLLDKLRKLGFSAEEAELFSAPQAAVSLLRQFPGTPCHLLLETDVRRDFVEFAQVPLEEAEAIVIGDIGDAWSYELLNRIFNRLLAGARLIVIHRNRYWQTEAGLKMDIGGFVAALEYCSGVQATVIGKPSADFFSQAVKDMNLTPEQVIVVGDDIDSDIGGGQDFGLTGVLVRTGKFRQAYAEASPVRPHCTIDSIRDFPALLGIA